MVDRAALPRWIAAALWTAALTAGPGLRAARANTGSAAVETAIAPAFRDAVNGFGFALSGALARGRPDGSVFVSAPSVEMALAMTMNGARGATLSAMGGALGLGAMPRAKVNAANAALLDLLLHPVSKVEIAAANSLWGQAGVEFAPAFVASCTTGYRASVRSVDFTAPSAAQAINAWVGQQTRGRISRLVDAGAVRDALMVLANAVYFHGAWASPFEERRTHPGPFTRADGQVVDVPMMERTGRVRQLETDQFQAVCLPYGDGTLCAYAFLPRPGASLAAFAAQLQPEAWNRWMGQFQAAPGTVILPRFKNECATALRAALSRMGMARAFGPGADFGDMLTSGAARRLGGRPLISEVLHRTTLEVTERGSTAAAATGVIIGITAMPAQAPFVFRADRPFFFAIRDERSGVLLFHGLVNDPGRG